MKWLSLLLTFIIALICLFSLQSLWLYYTYQQHLKSIEENVNSIFYEAVEKELDEHLMATYNISFNINKVDSIFRSLMQLKEYPFSFRINYEDSESRIIEIADQSIGNGFKTGVLPIINGEGVSAIVKITTPFVFKNMLTVLTVSILSFFFISACLIYGIKMFINQHRLYKIRDNFVQALTHDMKTPLATIHSALLLLEEVTINKDTYMRKKFSSIAIEQVHNLQATVNQILTLACVKKKQFSIDKQSIDIHEIIKSLIDKFTVKSDKSIEFQTSCDLKSSVVYADSFHLQNAISNLIDNAIKYSGNPVKIEIECEAKENHIYIRVKDNGFGISPNDQLKIFKPFERGAEIKRHKISGFGIGLNYVQQVIKAHEGTVAVLSQEGAGSEFIIALPDY